MSGHSGTPGRHFLSERGDRTPPFIRGVPVPRTRSMSPRCSPSSLFGPVKYGGNKSDDNQNADLAHGFRPKPNGGTGCGREGSAVAPPRVTVKNGGINGEPAPKKNGESA